jgi:GntR family transcriptional regulator
MYIESDFYKALNNALEKPVRGPAYHRLALAIESLINNKTINRGERLPAERDIAEQTNLSRTTIRRAFKELLDSQIIVAKRGSGHFILEKYQAGLKQLAGFTEEVAFRGHNPEAKLIEQSVDTIHPDDSLKLNASFGDEFFIIRRIRYADEMPIAIEKAIVPVQCIIDPDEPFEGSLYQKMSLTRNQPVRAMQKIQARLPEGDEANLLEIKPETPILRLERIGYNALGRVVELTHSAYRGDRYSFYTELTI